ncbi:HD family hydrolase [Streptomyces chartreusis]|uniref:HD domain-containing protein n=1 Tax=Streptomyces chartreusis TaxID=1969 RepID=UPI0036AFEA7E
MVAVPANEPIDLGRMIELVLLQDLVEVYAGDTPLYDSTAGVAQQTRELAAVDAIFGLHPADQARRMRSLWDEFGERHTPEAGFAKAMDRLQPRCPRRRRPGPPGRDRRGIFLAAGRGWRLIDEGERRGWARSAAPEQWTERRGRPCRRAWVQVWTSGQSAR